ncbi:PAS domain-containing protein [Phnomibacter ginsenosidimutans]|uniref:PAS domain S-box protein n=1 Tax=Phnomibacter ginsenosidimutans TaxID=2676868 RepID=A0A6I6GH12_9BACT|nr:PAS domain S-box protein [Phnomibacter ginsenosidimutans]QGW27665.1 PAS domain S-box protein [Phnomibacter ginsenosidimutans]
MTFVDITQRKIAEETLVTNEAKFRRIAEQMTDMVWIGDLQYKASYVSPSVEKIYGLTVEEYFTTPLEKRFPQHSIDTFKTLHQKLLAELEANPALQSREVTMEIEAYRKDGTPIWVKSTTKILGATTTTNPLASWV